MALRCAPASNNQQKFVNFKTSATQLSKYDGSLIKSLEITSDTLSSKILTVTVRGKRQ